MIMRLHFSTSSLEFHAVNLKVVTRAVTFCAMVAIAQIALSVASVVGSVFPIGSAEYQILNSVVASDSVLMMNHFGTCETPSDTLLHYKPVLKYPTPALGRWMFWTLYSYIPTIVYSAPLKGWVIAPLHLNSKTFPTSRRGSIVLFGDRFSAKATFDNGVNFHRQSCNTPC